ncbi:hypothetical protein C3L33_03542, partial [Rhododendron williamsianum]
FLVENMIADEQGFVSLTFYKIELELTVYPYVVVNELEKKEFNLDSSDFGFAGPTILFFQENAGNDITKIGVYHFHAFLQRAALDHLVQRTDIDTSRIVVFGRSLGGAVGAVLTRNNPEKVAALILENTFTSILDMAGVLLPFLRWFIGGSGSKSPKVLNFLVRSPWSTVDVIGQVSMELSNSQSFSSLACKMRWFLQCTCECYMLKRLHITADAPLWNILLASIWTHGWPVVITIGERFYSFWNKMFQRTRGAVRFLSESLEFLLLKAHILQLHTVLQGLCQVLYIKPSY